MRSLETKSKSGQILVNLQICRCFAALAVTIGHAEHELITRKIGGVIHPITAGWFPWGSGVDIFFVLSGFMMIYASRNMSGGVADARRFLRRRILRITPTYWLFTALMLLAMVAFSHEVNHSQIAAYHVLASLFYIPIPGPTGEINPILGVGWTLNYEMFFYVVFSMTLLLPARMGRVALPVVLIGLVIFGAFSTELAYPVKYWTQPILLEFLAGCALAQYHLRGTRLSAPIAIMLLVVGVALLCAAEMAGLGETQQTRFYALGVPATMIVGALAYVSQLQDRATVRFLRMLGDASYAMYLAHPFAINVAAIVCRKLPLFQVTFFYSLSIALSFIAAVAVYKLIEAPLQEYFRRRWDARPER